MNKFRKCLIIFCMVAMVGVSSTVSANYLVVTPEQVAATPEGLFVNINDISIAVESLFAANDGFIVAVPIPNPHADVCPNCGNEGYTPGKFCPWCNFPDDAKVRK